MEVIVQRHFGSERATDDYWGPQETQPAYFAHVANTQSTGAAFSGPPLASLAAAEWGCLEWWGRP